MKKSLLLSALFTTFFAYSFAQRDITLSINHMLGSEVFEFNQAATNDLNQSFAITRIDYYISGIKLIHDGGIETPVSSDLYILAKGIENVNVYLGNFDVTNLEGFEFYIGVNDPVNTQDPNQWLAPHPLALQSPSMHWGWSSGYRFAVIEGTAGAQLNTMFQLHGLWNDNYFRQTILTTGASSQDEIIINLNADYTQALRGIDVNSGPISHGTNGDDLTMLENMRDYVFTAGSTIPLNIGGVEDLTFIQLYPNPAKNSFNVNLGSTDLGITDVIIYDITGKKTHSFSMNNRTQFIAQINVSGIYFVRFMSEETVISTRKLIIE